MKVLPRVARLGQPTEGRAAVISKITHHEMWELTINTFRNSRPVTAEAASSLACRARSVSSWLRRYQCNLIGDRAQIGTDAGAVRVDDDVAASRGARQCEDAAGIEIRRAKADRADKRRSVAHRHRVGRYDRADGGRVRYLRCVRSYRDHSRWWRRGCWRWGWGGKWRWRRDPHDCEAGAGRHNPSVVGIEPCFVGSSLAGTVIITVADVVPAAGGVCVPLR